MPSRLEGSAVVAEAHETEEYHDEEAPENGCKSIADNLYRYEHRLF